MLRTMADQLVETTSPRERIVDAASQLLAEGGRAAVSTRAICDVAGVQPPTIYRLFENKDGLLDAVAMRGFLAHQTLYGSLDLTDDPIFDLRTGWDQHIAFALANPYLYSVMYGTAQPNGSRAAVAANATLRGLIHRIAAAGLLTVGEDFAAFTLNAAGCGTALSLIALQEAERDAAMIDRIRDRLIASITRSGPDRSTHRHGTVADLVATANSLDAQLDTSDALTPEERALLHQWLRRMALGA